MVFLGKAGNSNKVPVLPTATGFLVNIDGVFHLVTAKHVIYNSDTDKIQDDNFVMFFNGKDGEIQARKLSDVKNRFKCDWIFHKDRSVDVAIIPSGYMPEIDDVSFISKTIFQGADQLHETFEIFFLSYEPGIKIGKRVRPIFRTGIISSMNEDKTFYIDAPAFPGNSGSPVFLSPSLLFDKSLTTIGGGKFIGIVGEYLSYQDIAYSRQTGLPRVVFQENKDLSRVWSVSYLNEIIEYTEFQDQVSKIP